VGEGASEDLGLPIFCDASFSADHFSGGVGVFVPALKWRRAWSLTSVPSVFVAEMAAISQALLIGLETGAVKFVVYSDSLSAIRALQGHIRSLDFRHPSALEVGYRLYEALRGGVEVKVCWVRGHSGVLGNEEADALSRLPQMDAPWPQLEVAVVAADARPVVLSVVMAGWEDEWSNSPKGRCLYSLHPSVKLPGSLDRFRGREAALLSRLRTGHVRLNWWAFRLGLARSPRCACGAAEETVDHFLLECGRFQDERRQFLHSVGAAGSLHDLLRARPHAGPDCLTRLRKVVKFCDATRRFV